MMIEHIDDIVFYLRNSDSKKPMPEDVLAKKLEMTPQRFKEVMNVICDIVPAPVNRAYKEVSENLEKGIPGFKGYVYWPTGVIEKAKRQHIVLSQPKPANQTQAYLESVKKVSADTYEPPIVDQAKKYDPPIFGSVPEVKKVSNTPAVVTIADQKPDYSDKPKAYQILKYIEANPGSDAKAIQKHCGLRANMQPYISGYLARGEVTFTFESGVNQYKVSKPVDEFYGHGRKPLPKKSTGDNKHETATIPQQPQETTATDTVDAQRPSAEPKRVAMPEIQTATVETVQSEVGNESVERLKSQFRCAYTNDGCLVFIENFHIKFELNAEQTNTLIDYISETVTPIGVSI